MIFYTSDCARLAFLTLLRWLASHAYCREDRRSFSGSILCFWYVNSGGLSESAPYQELIPGYTLKHRSKMSLWLSRRISVGASHSNACIFSWHCFLCTFSRGVLSEHVAFDCSMPLIGPVNAIKRARTVFVWTLVPLLTIHIIPEGHTSSSLYLPGNIFV